MNVLRNVSEVPPSTLLNVCHILNSKAQKARHGIVHSIHPLHMRTESGASPATYMYIYIPISVCVFMRR